MSDEREAYTAFFTAEYAAVVRTATLMLGDRVLAEDVAQDAFAQLYAHWRKVSRYERPGAWVRRVAIRLAGKRMRRRRDEPVTERFGTDAVEPGLDVRRAVLGLPHAQRAAVVLHYYEDRPVSEVAELMGCAEGTAKVHLHRARARLAHVLAEETTDVV